MLYLALLASYGLAEQMPFQTYTIEDGLPQSTVQSMGQDAQGYLWFGTQQGICRYDGVRTDYPDQDRLINAVRSFLLDAQGRLWIASDRGLFVYDGRELVAFPYQPLVSASIWKLDLDNSHNLWVASSSGLYRIDPSLTCHSVWDQQAVIRTLVCGKDHLLFAVGRHLNALDRNHRVVFSHELPAPITALNEVPDLGLLIGTSLGMYKLSPLDNELIPVPGFESRSLNSISILDDQIWIGTDNGAVRCSPTLTRPFEVGVDQGLSHDTVYVIFRDREGSIWLGTDAGACRLKNQAFTQFLRRDGLPSETIWSLYEQTDVGIWVGTDRGLARITNHVVEVPVELNRRLPSSVVRAIETDGAQSIWIGTTRGLWHQEEGARPEFDGLFIRSLAFFEQKLWIGTDAQGAFQLGAEGLQVVEGLPHARVYAIEANEHGVWFATERGLAHLWQGQLMVLDEDDGLPHHRVLSVLANDDGVWIGTDDGLAHFKDKLTRRYTTANGMLDAVCYFLLRDSQQKLWVGTNRGLSRLEKTSFSHFSDRDGLSYSEMNVGAGLTARDQSLWVGSFRGLTRVDVNALVKERLPHDVFIHQFDVYGTSIPLNDVLTLEHHQNYIRIGFTAPCGQSGDGIQFRTQLRGLDATWHLGSERSVQYGALPPGKYQFVAQARGHDGSFNGHAAHLDFEIEPQFWATAWFRVLIILTMLSLLTWLFIDLRQRNLILAKTIETERADMLRQEAEIRLMHAQMNPHFVQNTLNNAIFFTHDEPDKAESILTRLSYMLRRTFDSAQKGWSSLEDEFTLCRNYLEIQRIRFEQRLQYHIELPSALSTIQIPTFTVQPLVENAVVHGFKQLRTNQDVQLFVSTTERGCMITVSNPAPPLKVDFESLIRSDHALGNIDTRLRILLGSGLHYEYREGRHHISFAVEVEP